MSRFVRGCLVLSLVLGSILVAAGGFAVWRASEAIQAPYQGFSGSERVVRIESGATVTQTIAALHQAGVLESELLARTYWQFVLDEPPLQAGEYRFRGPQTLPAVLAKLERGEVLTHPVTLIEGLTLEETAAHLANEGFGREERFLEEMQRVGRIVDLDPDAPSLEGYLFPDTYAFSAGTSEADVVSTLVATFRSKLEAVNFQPGGTGPIGSPRDLVVLASIVEKEAQRDDERPVIAAVYTNRLRIGMGLYADPTIIYALKQAGTWDGNLRRRDLEMDSPYNTYRTQGLPPGPIGSPGLASLQAAAQPADVDYLYFVSRNDGSHVFARTLAEHNRNVYEWQKLYWQRRWAEERERDKLH